MSRPAPWHNSGGRLLLALLALHVVLKVVMLIHVARTPFMGDETQYVDGARALSNLPRDLSSLSAPHGDELRLGVVASGWFMPGMSMLVAPVWFVAPHASLVLVRGWIGVITLALFVWGVLSLRRSLGTPYAVVYAVFPGLVPMWVLFSFAAWGDLAAGLLVVPLLVHVVRLLRALRVGSAPTWREGVVLGLLAVGVVYLRSSAVLVSFALCAMVGVGALVLLRGRRRARAVLRVAAAGVAFVALLLPWSLAASSTLGGRVITTTTVPLVRANVFGDRDQLCFGPCDPDSTVWFAPVRYAREVARATGTNEVEVLGQMSRYALRDLTPHRYAQQVVANAVHYANQPARFANGLHPPGGRGALYRPIVLVSRAMFFPALAAGLLFLVVPVRRRFDTQVLAIGVKLGLLALFSQPFVHQAGGRYWPTASPLLALAAALQGRSCRRSWRRPPAEDGSRALFAIQVAIAVGTLGVVLTVLTLAWPLSEVKFW